jgi:adenylate cyclase
MTAQRIGKYACLEVECRYLLSRIPNGLLESQNYWLITDRYFPNTRLRLRHMKSVSDNHNVYKLSQKYRTETQNAYETTITNIYLNEAEFTLLKSLKGKILEKKRYPYNAQNYSMSIDVFEGRHSGLILAEMELERKADVDGFVLPSFVLKDVTSDPFFTGGNLIAMAEDAFRQGLMQRIRDHENT